jgi:hypothetical protein
LNFLNTVERYDPELNQWEYVSSMNVKRSRMALVTCNSKLYAIGGYDGSSHLNSAEVYDPEKDKWTLIASMNSLEGVVGVGVLPYEIEFQTSSMLDQHQDNYHVHSLKNQITAASNSQFASISVSPFINNHYSLMEEEEEDIDTTMLTSTQTTANSQNSRN